MKWQIYNNITTTQISNVFKFWQNFFDMSVQFINQLRIRTKFVTFLGLKSMDKKMTNSDLYKLAQMGPVQLFTVWTVGGPLNAFAW